MTRIDIALGYFHKHFKQSNINGIFEIFNPIDFQYEVTIYFDNSNEQWEKIIRRGLDYFSHKSLQSVDIIFSHENYLINNNSKFIPKSPGVFSDNVATNEVREFVSKNPAAKYEDITRHIYWYFELEDISPWVTDYILTLLNQKENPK